jgi:membrane associated rhomboid family serine protease
MVGMLSLDLKAARGGTDPTGGDPRAFAEEVQRNAARLARFDLLLWFGAFALVATATSLVAWMSGILVLTAVPALLVAARGAVLALRRWHAVRRSDPAQALHDDRAEDDRARSLKELDLRLAATTPIGSYLLAASLVVVALAELVTGGPVRAAFLSGLVKRAVQHGDWWRVLSCTFVHADVDHLFANAVVLFALGRMIEAYDRPLRLPFVYLVSAVAGSIGSVLMSSRTSIGASGAVLGLAGYLLVVAGRSFSVPRAFRRMMWSVLGWTAVLGVLAFFRVDHGAHVGGAVGGAVAGLLTLPERRDPNRAGLGGDRAHEPTRLSTALDALGWLSWTVLLSAAVFTVLRLVLLR